MGIMSVTAGNWLSQHGGRSSTQSSKDGTRCGALLLFFSRPVRRSARATPSLHPRAGGGARTTSGRAAHATRDATRAARGESERRVPSELAVRVFSETAVLGFAPFSPPTPRALLLPPLRSPRPPTGGGARTTSGRATHARGAAHPA